MPFEARRGNGEKRKKIKGEIEKGREKDRERQLESQRERERERERDTDRASGERGARGEKSRQTDREKDRATVFAVLRGALAIKYRGKMLRSIECSEVSYLEALNLPPFTRAIKSNSFLWLYACASWVPWLEEM
jgi:hypothetical protein